jgi:alcohol dehydrogenase YqhD (iron-dependent ADH family)
MLSWLGSGVLSNLAGHSLEHAIAALLDISKGNRGAVSTSSISLVKVVLVVRHC